MKIVKLLLITSKQMTNAVKTSAGQPPLKRNEYIYCIFNMLPLVYLWLYACSPLNDESVGKIIPDCVKERKFYFIRPNQDVLL